MEAVPDLVELPSFADFSEKLKKSGEELGVDIRAMHEDIFNTMHRI